MKTINRRSALAGLVGAATAAGANTTAAGMSDEDALIKAARLVLTLHPPKSRSEKEERFYMPEAALIAELSRHYEESPFPVPAWLSENKYWQRHFEVEREMAEGLYCIDYDFTFRPGPCDTCGTWIGWKSLNHLVTQKTDGKEVSSQHCPGCCPACKKRATSAQA